MNEQNQPQVHIVNQQRPESGTVTALSVISMIFGTIGLLGSFIPCLGAFAIWIAIPAALCGGAAFFVAKSKGVSIGFPVAAFVVSLLGLVISSVQIMAITSAGKAANDGIKEMDRQMREDAKRRGQQQP